MDAAPQKVKVWKLLNNVSGNKKKVDRKHHGDSVTIVNIENISKNLHRERKVENSELAEEKKMTKKPKEG